MNYKQELFYEEHITSKYKYAHLLYRDTDPCRIYHYAVLKGSGISLNELIADLRDASLWGLIPASIGALGFIWFEGEALRVIVRHMGYPTNGHRALSMPLQMCIFLLLHRRLPADSPPAPFS